MSEVASIIANTGLHQQMPDAQTSLKSPKGSGQNSFQEVLENGASQPQNQTANVQADKPQNVPNVNQTQPTTGISGVKLDAKLGELQNDLQQKYGELGNNPNPLSKSDLLPDLFYNKTKMGLLGEAMQGVNNTPKGTELLGRFSQVEGEYNQISAIMKSSKDLSPGELLGLQARLYQVGQHIEVMSKVVDQMAGGIKTILNTNV
ncbi:MAG: hypothetical protein ABI954_14525 [Pyrinomonadaceae bacterium]